MKTHLHLLAACILATSVVAPAAYASNAVTAQASVESTASLEAKAANARIIAEKARGRATWTRKLSNQVVGQHTSTKLARTTAELKAVKAETAAAKAEALFDQAEVNAATRSEAEAQEIELHTRQAANIAAAKAAKANAAAAQARATATELAVKAPDSPETRAAEAAAERLEQEAYSLDLERAATGQAQIQAEAVFTKAKARVIADRAIVAHRGIKGKLSLPLSMPLSKPITQGAAEVGPRIVGTPKP